MNEIQRFLNVLPRLTELRAIRERLGPLESLPMPSLGWAEELPELQRDEIELATRAEGLNDEITQLMTALDAISVDETALKLADRAGRLVELRARYLTAEKDIPERRLQENRAKTLEVWSSVCDAERDLREAEADAGSARVKLAAHSWQLAYRMMWMPVSKRCLPLRKRPSIMNQK